MEANLPFHRHSPTSFSCNSCNVYGESLAFHPSHFICLYVGYTVHVLGIESTCSLTQDNLDNKEDFPVVVEVVPSMPQLLVSSALPKVRSQPTDPDSPSSARLVTAVTLYAGQR